MKKYVFGVLLSFGVLISPALTQAALSDAQVQAILSLLSSFGADSATINNVNSALTSGAPIIRGESFCYNFKNNLTIGSNNNDVGYLRTALKKEDVLEQVYDSPFGEDDAAAVVSFQAKYGIRQTGYVGPLTRAKLNALYRCRNGEQPPRPPQPIPPTVTNFFVSPTSGPAPLEVSFSTVQWALGYTVYFGDGQWHTFTGNDTPECAVPRTDAEELRCSTWRTSHTYTSPSTYIVQLQTARPSICDGELPPPPGTDCAPKTVGTVTITVTSDNNASFSASPTSGPAPLAVRFTARGISETEARSYSINFGDGQSGSLRSLCSSMEWVGPGPCFADAPVSHTYTSPGTYTAKLLYTPPVPACPVGEQCARPTSQVIGTAKITVTDSSSSRGAPVVNGIDGPVSLNAGQVGKWTVKASVPNQSGAQLSYSVKWGDEGSSLVPMASSPVQTSIQTSAMFTHVYNYNGTYKPKFSVSNNIGASSAEMSVSVGAIPIANNSRLTVTAPASVTVGSSYVIQWGGLSGPTLEELSREYPTALGEMIAYNSDQSLGVAQTVFHDVPIGILLNGNTSWKVGTLTNDGRQLPSGKYYIAFYVSVPSEGYSTAIAQGNSDTFYLIGTPVVISGGGSGGSGSVSALPAPAASLTFNNKTSDTVSVGDTYRYNWSSTNADVFSSNYSATCISGAAWNDVWAADSAQGSASGTISPDAAGCTYTVNYTATQSSTEKKSTSQVTVIVRATTASNGINNPNLASVASAFMIAPKDKPSPTQTFTYQFTQDLWRGQEGPEVRALQRALMEEGLFSGEITGAFYDQTVLAVKEFQTRYDITATGYVGPLTRTKLNELY